MMQRERVRSSSALEVLALLPRYKPARHPDATEAQETTNRRFLAWEATRRVLRALLDDEHEGPELLAESAWSNDGSGGGDGELDYACLGRCALFGEECTVYALPLLYIAGKQQVVVVHMCHIVRMSLVVFLAPCSRNTNPQISRKLRS